MSSSSDSAAALRSILASTDMSAPSIKKAAGSMMKHYDRSAGVAVNEWRNALQTVQNNKDQLLPLWYVANEVLQNSKRNRGNKFLEAFAPILGQSMAFICSRSDAETVEKVRRTAKIWGDRQVYSIKFIGELLKGVDQYRHQDNSAEGPQEPVNFSPMVEPGGKSSSEAEPSASSSPGEKPRTEATIKSPSTSVTPNVESSDDDDDSLGFGGIGEPGRESSEGLGHLDIDLAMIDAAAQSSAKAPATKKRRRNSAGNSTPRRKTVLSTTSLMELWTQVESLQQGMENSKSIMQVVDTSLDTQIDADQLVGDELVEQYKLAKDQLAKVEKQRQSLHGIANDRHSLEKQAVRYIPWLQRALVQDDEDIAFCQALAGKLHELKVVHGAAKAARDEKRQKVAERRAKEEEESRKKEEEDERRQMLDAVVKTEQEAKPGQVWNKATQEYVYLNTDDSWRDH